MRTHSRSPFVLFLAALPLFLVATGCLRARVDAEGEPAAAVVAGANEVLATVGGREIEREAVETSISTQLAALERQRQDLVAQALDQTIEKTLIELEAEKEGITSDALLESRLAGKVPEPTDAEVDAFYEERKSQINQPKEQISGQIRNYLRQVGEQKVYQDLVADLRKQYEVVKLLEPFRAEIDIAGAPAKGPADAPVTLVEFSDFECPYCSRVTPTLAQLEKNYGDKLRLVFLQFPLPMHSNAQKAAEASLCAHEQGRFWEMHDQLFANQRALGVEQLKGHAGTVGLDAAAFGDCLDSGKYATQVASDMAQGQALGVNGTPAMFVNGRFLSGAVPYDQIASLIDEELERAAR